MREDLEIEKDELIEKLGVFFEQEEHLAPLAARVLSLIILSGKKGASFNKLVNSLKASKSTISCYLEDLQVKNRIEFYLKEGERKRYFIVKRDMTMVALTKLLVEWKSRHQLYEDVLQFQNKCLNFGETAQDNFDIDFLNGFIDYTAEVIASIEKLKGKLEQ